MNSKLQPIRGTNDIHGTDYLVHEYIISTARNLSTYYGFEPVATPIIEYTEIFTKTLGDTSDVVTKEMYNFLDKSGENITLRPEFTSAICRFLISNGMFQKLPLKLFSYGPLFRYERPQKGRSRQFHQINFEAIGYSTYHIDTEIIGLTKILLEKLNIQATLQINSIGCSESREKYRASLVSYLNKYINELSEESKIRLEKNPLRILDSKNELDQKILQDAPKINDFYTLKSQEFFENLQERLTFLDIKFEINQKLVRGLDYYNDTVFEWVSDHLGAQATIMAGGRYDNLINLMGGDLTCAFGFAAGIERLALLTKYQHDNIRPIALIFVGDQAYNYVEKLAFNLRQSKIKVFIDFDSSVTKQMKKANKAFASHALIIGESELNCSIAKLKNLDEGKEISLPFSEISSKLQLIQGVLN